LARAPPKWAALALSSCSRRLLIAIFPVDFVAGGNLRARAGLARVELLLLE